MTRLFFIIFLVLFSFNLFASAKNVLIVHSYHPEYQWTSIIDESIKKRLLEYHDLKIATEYLDTKRYKSKEYFNILKDSFVFKYGGKRVDLVVAVDNNALDFVVNLKGTIFSDTPVVFCGINNFNKKMLKGYDDITGIREDISFIDTVNLIKKLHPRLKKIIIFGDDRFLVFRHTKRFLNDFFSLKKDIKFEIVENKYLEELVEKYKNLSDVAFIVSSSLYFRNGRFLLFYDASRYLAKRFKSPFYTFWDVVVYNGGAVGGKVVSAKMQGELAADYVIKILIDGVNPKELKIATSKEANQWIFDYNFLKTFGIDRSLLPDEKIIINAPAEYVMFSKTKVFYLSALLIVVLISGVIIIFYKTRAENILKLYKIITDNSYDIILETDIEGNIYQIRGNFKKLLGFERGSILNMNVNQFYLNESERKEFVDKILKEGKITNTLRVLKDKDGNPRYFLESSTLFKRGKKIRFLNVLKDITDELAQKADLEFYEYIFKNAPLFIFITELNGKILKVNKFSCDMLKVDQFDLIGKNIRRFIDVGKIDLKKFFREIETNGFWQGELQLMATDGKRYCENAVITKMKYKDSDVLIQFGVDITRLKKMERKIEASQKLEIMGKLAGSIAHDFNNILTVISNYVQFLKLKMDNEKDMEIANRILESINKGARFISQLLAFGRQVESNPVIVNLSKFLEDEKETFRRVLDDSIMLKVDVRVKKIYVKIDIILLEQMFLNLIKNAEYALLKSDKKEKFISISLDKVVFEESRPFEAFEIKKGKYAYIVVEDNGIGMDASLREKIFEPFFTTKPAGEGSGLGLASVYGFVKRFDGYIIVDSEKGEYTKFEIYLPIHEGDSEPLKDEKKKIAKEKGIKRVVCIDDNEEVLESLKLNGLMFGVDVICFSNPDEGLKFIFNEKDIDCVVTDVSMPVKSGNDVVKALLESGFDKKIIVMSGHGIKNVDENLLKNKNVKFIKKPLKITDIIQNV